LGNLNKVTSERIHDIIEDNESGSKFMFSEEFKAEGGSPFHGS